MDLIKQPFKLQTSIGSLILKRVEKGRFISATRYICPISFWSMLIMFLYWVRHVASVLATWPKGRWFKAGRGDGFLRPIKIRSTPSFGWEVMPEVRCSKILRHIKDPLTCLRY
jgi:hypothetical protein